MATRRDMASALPSHVLQALQAGTLQYSWRGVPCLKNPFDFALYFLLVWHIKPGTIIEIGSNAGGSALWLADMLRIYGIAGRVVSVDVNEVKGVADPAIQFLVGDANNLELALSHQFLADLPRPWLVIEDSSHHYSTSLSVLQFFDPWLQPGELIIIEDGIIDDMGMRAQYDGGPNRAISEFLQTCGERYAIDASLCDYFGHNVTWNTNGYLRKMK